MEWSYLPGTVTYADALQRVLLNRLFFFSNGGIWTRSQQGNDPWNLLMLKDGRSWRGLLISLKFQLILLKKQHFGYVLLLSVYFWVDDFPFWLGSVSSQDPPTKGKTLKLSNLHRVLQPGWPPWKSHLGLQVRQAVLDAIVDGGHSAAPSWGPRLLVFGNQIT